MAETPLVVLMLAACGGMTFLVVVRALRDVFAHRGREEAQTQG